MSNQPVPTTPNHAPQPTLTPKEALSPDKIGEFRDKQKDALYDKLLAENALVDRSKTDGVKALFAANELQVMNANYLKAIPGLSEGNQEYDQYMDMLRAGQINPLGPDKWNVDLGGQPQKEIYEARWNALFNPEATTPNPDMTPNFSARYIQLERRLERLGNRLAQMTAQRQGKLFTFKNERYNRLHELYQETMADLGKRREKDLAAHDPNRDRDQQVADTITFIFQKQAQLREKTVASFQETKVSKFINWFNKGNFLKRFIKGASIGVVAGLAGAGIGVLTGGTGFAMLGAGIGATLTAGSRFARGYAASDNAQGRGMRKEFDQTLVTNIVNDFKRQKKVSHDEIMDQIVGYTSSEFNSDTKKEQVKRLKAVGWGMAGVAVGSLVAFAGHELVTSMIPPTDVTTAASAPQPGKIYGPPAGPGIPDAQQGGGNHIAPIAAEYSSDAKTFNSGEGWFQEFKQLGITNPDQQAALLKEVGPKLTDMGVAYEDSHIGGYGINRAGAAPQAALDYIHQVAVQKGYLSN